MNNYKSKFFVDKSHRFVTSNGYLLKREVQNQFNFDMKNDKKYVLEAVKQDSNSLEHASYELRNDKDVVLEALKQNGCSIRYSSKFRNNKEFILEAVKRSGFSLEYTSEELRNDKEFVLEVVKLDGLSLKYASLRLRDDKEVVLEAVKQNGLSLQFASSKLRSKKQFVLESVKQSGTSLVCASSELRNDKEILFSRKLEGEIDVSTDEFLESTFSRFSSFNERCEGWNFDDLVFDKHLGRGVYGGTYLCRKLNSTVELVIKIYNNPFAGSAKKEEILIRDSLYIPNQENVVPILKHWTNETIDLYKFSDYEEYWKDQARGKRHIRKCGAILMNYYPSTLNKYLKARLKTNKRFEIGEIRLMFWGLICGVCHLHNFMIVHRDLHGDNIFVSPNEGRILIGDFGCCLDLRNNTTKFRVHKDHELMFSFTRDTFFKRQDGSELIGFKKGGYSKMISPEIQNFNPLKDEFLDYSKSDIYSIGVLGFILLDHLKEGEEDSRLSKFMEKLVIEEPEKRLGCLEAMELGKFILFIEVKKCSNRTCPKVESEGIKFKVCGGCKLRSYCCRKCQVQDWRIHHKNNCRSNISNNEEKS